MNLDKIFELQTEYSEKYPNDDFDAFDYFNALGTDGLIQLFKDAKGRRIVVKTNTDDELDDEQIVDFDFI